MYVKIISTAYDRAFSDPVVTRHFVVTRTYAWLTEFIDAVKTEIQDKELCKTFYDELIPALIEGYENIVRHSNGESTITLTVTPDSIAIAFKNPGDLKFIHHLNSIKRFIKNLKASNKLHWDMNESFGAGILIMKKYTDQLNLSAENGMITTSLTKYFDKFKRAPSITYQ